MDGQSIEVPTLTTDSLVQTLQLASDPAPSSLHRADSTLTAWERTEPKFSLLLLDIAFNHQTATPSSAAPSYALDVRIGAIIRLKNICEKFWRPRVVSRVQLSLSDEVKAHVRNLLLQRAVVEPDRTIAVQASVCIAKIARTDFPAQWPDLFDFLQQRMQASYAAVGSSAQLAPEQEQQYRLVLLRSAEICTRALKTLASAKLLASKIRMTELSRQLLPALHPIFTELFRSNLPATGGDIGAIDLNTLGSWAMTPLLAERIRTTHLLLKCLTHLAVADLGMITARTSSTRAPSDPEPETTSSLNLAQEFFRSMPVFLQQIFDLRSALVSALLLPGSSSQTRSGLKPLLANLTKHFIAFSKLFLALIERDKSKAARWEGWTEVILWYWSRASEYDPHSGKPLTWDATVAEGLEGLVLYEDDDLDIDAGTQTSADPGTPILRPARFVIHALVLLRLTLAELKRPGTTIPASVAPLLSDDFLGTVIETLMSRHMLLTRPALQSWLQDPENWVIVDGQGADTVTTDGSAGDEVDIRHAAERLLIGVVQVNKKLAEKIWSHFDGYGPPQDLQAFDFGPVVQREALYNALGYITPYLDDADARVSTAVKRLLAQASILDNNRSIPSVAPSTWMIIRRRILLLIDSWIEHIPEADLAECFPVVIALLQDAKGQTDLVVRLTAAGTLWQLVDTPNFKPEMLAPTMEDALRLLCALISQPAGDAPELEELSSFRTCTRTLALVTERMGAAVAPHVPVLAGLIPSLWQRDDDQCKVRPGVLVLTGRLLSAIALVIPADGSKDAAASSAREQLGQLHAIAAHMIEESLQPAMAALIGVDAIHLWSRALASTPYMTDPLFQLLRLSSNLVTSPDYAQHICSVISSSALLAPNELIAQYGEAIWAEAAAVIADDTSSSITFVLKMVDEVLLATGQGGQAVSVDESNADLWAQVAVHSGLAHALLGATLHFQESTSIAVTFISAIARMAVTAQPGVFLQIFRDSAVKLAPTLNASSPGDAYAIALKRLVQLFCERFENIASRHRRRLVGLAMAKMLEDADPGTASDVWLYELIPDMVTPWTEVLEDEQERRQRDAGGGPRASSPLDTIGEDIDDIEWLDDGGPSPETARWSNLRERDPARSGQFAAQLSRVLGVAQNKAPDAFNGAMGKVDPLVLDILMRGLQALTAGAHAS